MYIVKNPRSSFVPLVVGTTLCTAAFLFSATYSSADIQSTPTPSAATIPSATAHHGGSSARRSAIKAANQAYTQSVMIAARKAAWSAYKVEVSAVREAFNQAIAAANDARTAAISAAPAPSPTK